MEAQALLVPPAEAPTVISLTDVHTAWGLLQHPGNEPGSQRWNKQFGAPPAEEPADEAAPAAVPDKQPAPAVGAAPAEASTEIWNRLQALEAKFEELKAKLQLRENSATSATVQPGPTTQPATEVLVNYSMKKGAHLVLEEINKTLGGLRHVPTGTRGRAALEQPGPTTEPASHCATRL